MAKILANTQIVGAGLPTDKALDVLFLTTDLISVLNNGNVGIGTATPTDLLSVYTTKASTGTTNPNSISLGGTYSTVNGANLKLKIYDASGFSGGFGASYNGSGSPQLFYRTWTTLVDHVFYGETNKLMTIKGTGNVGIGTETPTAKLHVQGTDATSSNYALKTDNSTGTPLLYVANDGGVGVGVAPQFNVSATFKTKNSGTGTGFQVFNSASTKLFSIREDGFGTKFPGFVIMGLDNDPYSTLHIVKQTANTTYSRGLFRVEQTYNSTNPDFMITEIGKVVVGKANTTYGGDYKVEFNSPQNTVLGVPSTFNMALNTTNAFGQDIGGGITFGGTYDAVNTTAFGGINAVKLNAISGDYNGRLNLWVRATAGAINALSIINNGNVGIGTTTPTSKLHAVGIDATSSNFALKLDNLASSPLLYVRNDGVVSINSTNNSQLLLNTGGVTGISFLNYSQGNQQIYFDAVFENGYTIAKNTSALGLINFNGVMRFTGNTGLTVGNSFSLNTLMNLDASTKNLSIGLGDASGTARLHLYGAGGINYALKVENGLINMSNLQTGITGLVAGDLFKYADATSPSGFSIGIMP